MLAYHESLTAAAALVARLREVDAEMLAAGGATVAALQKERATHSAALAAATASKNQVGMTYRPSFVQHARCILHASPACLLSASCVLAHARVHACLLALPESLRPQPPPPWL